MKKNILILCLALLATFCSLSGAGARTDPDTYRQLEIFSNVLSLLEKNYVEEVNVEDLIQGAIKGMLGSLDPHSSYLKPEDFKELQVETKGSFTGIGIEITIRDGILTVVSPIEGTPAYEKGVKAGDSIVRINGETTKDMTLMDAVKKLRGPKGSEVTISIYREGWKESKDITIVRDIIPLVSVKEKMLDPEYLYVRVTNFQAKTAHDLREALQKAGPDIKGLILDLRNNPGGLLDQAVKVADLFLKEGIIVSTRGRLEEQTVVYRARTTADDFAQPMIVLVNEGSASASEIVAGALKDHRRALILGARTFGKGSVQTIIPMNNGAGLRLTTARYYTPSGTSIQATGITPDIIVPSRSVELTEKKSKRKIIREKDLRHHITNDRENGDQQEENGEENGKPFAPAEVIKKDQQLYTALVILKGVNVFEDLLR